MRQGNKASLLPASKLTPPENLSGSSPSSSKARVAESLNPTSPLKQSDDSSYFLAAPMLHPKSGQRLREIAHNLNNKSKPFGQWREADESRSTWDNDVSLLFTSFSSPS